MRSNRRFLGRLVNANQPCLRIWLLEWPGMPVVMQSWRRALPALHHLPCTYRSFAHPLPMIWVNHVDHSFTDHLPSMHQPFWCRICFGPYGPVAPWRFGMGNKKLLDKAFADSQAWQLSDKWRLMCGYLWLIMVNASLMAKEWCMILLMDYALMDWTSWLTIIKPWIVHEFNSKPINKPEIVINAAPMVGCLFPRYEKQGMLKSPLEPRWVLCHTGTLGFHIQEIAIVGAIGWWYLVLTLSNDQR